MPSSTVDGDSGGRRGGEDGLRGPVARTDQNVSVAFPRGALCKDAVKDEVLDHYDI